MDKNKLAELLYPDVTTLPEDILAEYPRRELPEGAKVTRIAPSPTGFIHFGTLFPALVCERLAHQSGGVFYLRIEDTDAKREVKGADMDIIRSLAHYQICFDEGPSLDGREKGIYGPYRQSVRKAIYQTFAKQLIREGKAYPCFCTAEELDEIRSRQEAEKLTTGYYGKWAKWRDASDEAIEAALAAGKPYVLRLRSEGDIDHKIKFRDLIKGDIEVTENDIDEVLLKSDGIPTYHFAHAVDDYLMGTTHVVRGEEWLPSLPKHIQIFSALGFRLPKYLHISQLMTLKEDGSKKKLSKRDMGASLADYKKIGYTPEGIIEYVMTLLNSNFEEWRAANPDKSYTEFPFSIKKMSPSGCLFDFAKLNDVSKNVIAKMTAESVYAGVSAWAKENDPEYYALLSRDPDYATRIFAIGRGGKKPRKDIAYWSEARGYMSFFYDELFRMESEMPEGFSKADIDGVLASFAESYNEEDDAAAWFDKIKDIAEKYGFARETKLYKNDPDAYKGHVGDVSAFLRIAVTGRQNSPDLYEVMKIMGKARVLSRVAAARKCLA